MIMKHTQWEAAINFTNLRILGALTVVLGLMYFPPIWEYLWGWRSAPIGLFWCFVQAFVGVALCSKEWMSERVILKTILLCNLVYQLMWSFVMMDHIVRVHYILPGYIPYLIHILLAIFTGFYFLKLQSKQTRPLK